MTITEHIEEIIETDMGLTFIHGTQTLQNLDFDEASFPAGVLELVKDRSIEITPQETLRPIWRLMVAFVNTDEEESSAANIETIHSAMRVKSEDFIIRMIGKKDSSTNRKIFEDILNVNETPIIHEMDRVVTGVNLEFDLVPMDKTISC